jgi:hypothetical protein
MFSPSIKLENMDHTRNPERIELELPKYDEENVTKSFGTDVIGKFSTSIEEITNWFSKYEVDSTELWISGVIETTGITKLVVSAKGEGGLKVVLKPKARP